MKPYVLKGKHVVITGASSGIGKELSRYFAMEGAHLILSALPVEEGVLKEWATELSDTYSIRTWCVAVDLAAPGGTQNLYEQAAALVPEIDVLVNNAGIISYKRFQEDRLETHRRIVAVNIVAYMDLMHLFLQDMVKRGHGRILNVSSLSAFMPTPFHAVYGSTKAFVQHLSEAVDQELKGTDVSIHTLNPGYTDTPLLKKGEFPDAVPFFKIGGLSDPADIAREAVGAFKKGTAVFIPGRKLQFMVSVMLKITPRRLTNFISTKMINGK